MGKSGLTGKVQTVLGPIDPEDLGVTITHEHLILDLTCMVIEPKGETEKAMMRQPVTMEILWWLRYNFFHNIDVYLFLDEEEAIKESMYFKLAGGNSIVEVTLGDLGRDPASLARISRATGLNVIMGSGYYMAVSHGPEMATKPEEEITEEIVRDITVGVDDTGIRSGIIGEIGCNWPLADTERKSLRASARAQKLTGAPLSVHPGQSEDSSMEMIRIVNEMGGDISRTVICHIDCTIR